METEYKLTYFTFKGRAEVIRLLFAAANVNFKDERLKYMGEEWESFKEKTPMKTIPVLTVGNKDIICQSTAIVRYLAKKFGFYGSSSWDELLIDEVVDCVKDMVSEVVKIFYEKDEAIKTNLQKRFLEICIPNFMRYVKIRQGDGGGFLVGSKMSLADIAVFDFVDQQIEAGLTCFRQHTGVMHHYHLVKSTPGIARWIQQRPDDVYYL